MEPIDGDQHPATIVTKLDILHSRQINRITKINLFIWSLSFVYLVMFSVLSNTVLSDTQTLTLRNGHRIHVKTFQRVTALIGFELVVAILCFILVLLIAICYTQRVIRNKSSPFVQEQVWVIMLLISSACYLNPLIPIWLLHDFSILPGNILDIGATPNAWFNQKWLHPALFVSASIRSFGFNITCIFSLWATAHTFGLLERPTTWRERRKFYLPKLIPIALYQCVRFVAYRPGRVYLSHFPLANFVTMCLHFSVLQEWNPISVSPILLLTVFELFFIVMITRQVRITWKRLAGVDYLRYRSKQIGFRFFVAHNLAYYTFITAFEILNPLLIPRYLQLRFWLSTFKTHLFTTYYGQAFVYLMLLANLTITAYINLPPDSVGIRGWFNGSTNRIDAQHIIEAEPLMVATHELPSHLNNHEVHVHANSVVLETHVSLFNFAWLVYEWNTKKHGRTTRTCNRFLFRIEQHIKDDRSDTNMIVVNGSDRIILAFRGTNSAENMRTDMQMVTRALCGRIPTIPSATYNSNTWKWARVHKGFIDSYLSICKEVVTAVKKLLDEEQRPILLTGHSLGGALATICSLDLRISLGLPASHIIVSTFGSPRCGNASFRSVYDELVPIHWRFEVENDLVTKLPKVRYCHVGKRVLIDTRGNMFLDPNALEMLLWSGGVASWLYHKKASYMLGMRSFCRKYLSGSFDPGFWDFPVDNADLRIWEEKTAVSLAAPQDNSVGDEDEFTWQSLQTISKSPCTFGDETATIVTPTSVTTPSDFPVNMS